MTKPLSEFLTESTEPTLSVAQFPVLLQTMRSPANSRSQPKRNEELLHKLIDAINEYAGKPVPNPVFEQNIKYYLSSVFEVANDTPEWAYQSFRDATGPDNRRPEWSYKFDLGLGNPGHVPGKLKKLMAELPKVKNDAAATRYYRYYIAIFEELTVLVNRVAILKTRVFKRQPKPIEDRRAKYVAPMMEHEAGRIILKVLTDLTNELKDRYADGLFEYWCKEAEYWNAMTKEEQRKRYMFLSTVGSFHDMWETVDENGKPTNYARGAERLKTTWKTTVRAKAAKAAKETQEAFIIKNAKKLGMLVKNKGVALDGEPEIKHLKVGGRGFEGELAFKFVDGSSFTVRNKTVWKMNQYRTEFTQYPTTFHDVIMPDGKPMGMPSEERMNRVFCNKPDAGFRV